METLPLAAVPELVGAGVISGARHDYAPSTTPDGNTMFFTVTDPGFTRMTLMQSHFSAGKWQAPTVLPFSGTWNDGDGVLSPDGLRFVFISNRPAQGNTAKRDLDLWQVDRSSDGQWATPRRLPDAINSDVNEVYPSIAADGTLYFGRAGTGNPIFAAPRTGEGYGEPVRLAISGFSFAVAPDQSFGILGIADSGNFDLHFVKRSDGKWGLPVKLAGPVNSPGADLAGSISADARTLYFVSTRRDLQPGWPRQRRVTTAQEVGAELDAELFNGLRNIYKVRLGELAGQSR